MNVEFITADGEKGRYTGVSYFKQGRDGVGLFTGDDLGFVLADALVTYAGPGHTGTVSTADEISMEDEMADLRNEAQTTDGKLIGGSFAYSAQDSVEEEVLDSSSSDEHRGQ
jgi:hypothetical protein